MPSIRLLTRSTIFKLRPFLSTSRLSSSTAESPRNEYEPGYHPPTITYGNHASKELARRQPSRWKVLRLQREGWLLANVFSEKGIYHHIHRLRKDNWKEYEQWLRKEHAQLQALEGSEFEIIERGCKLELVHHIDAIESFLGYRFNSYNGLLAILPRFPRRLVDYQIHALAKSVFFVTLGKLVLQLALRDAHQWHELDDNFLRRRGIAIGIYSFFVEQATYEPIKPTSTGHVQLFNKYHKREFSRLACILPGIFGVLFQDGGMDAVKTVLKHTNFLGPNFLGPQRNAAGSQLLPQKIGLNVSQILFMTSMWRFAVDISRIRQCMHERCKESWQAHVCTKPEVLQFMNSYKFENPSEAPAESDPALRYREFLGRCYRDGGISLVREMLNRFEPEFSGPKYPPKFEKRLPHLVKVFQNRFW